MCMFCAAIPATLAVGVNVNAKQIRNRREAEERGETLLETITSPGKEDHCCCGRGIGGGFGGVPHSI